MALFASTSCQRPRSSKLSDTVTVLLPPYFTGKNYSYGACKGAEAGGGQDKGGHIKKNVSSYDGEIGCLTRFLPATWGEVSFG